MSEQLLKPLTFGTQPTEDPLLKPLALAVEPEESLLKPLEIPPGNTPPTSPPPSDLLGAVGRGIETSLNPFGVDEKEYKKERTTGEAVAEGAANIITDIASTIAVGAATGAVAGSVVPGAGTAVGTAVGVGLGIYRALGYEDLMSRVEKRDFSLGKAAVNVAVETLPALKIGGKVTKGLAQGTLGSLQALQYGAGVGTALTIGAIGGGMAGLTTKGKKDHAKATAALMAEPDLPPKYQDWAVEALEHNDSSVKIADRAAEYASQDVAELATFERLSREVDFFDLARSPKKATALVKTLKAEDVGVDPNYVKSADAAAQKMGMTGEEMLVRIKIEGEVKDVARGLLNLPSGKKVGAEELEKAGQILKAEGTSFHDAFVAMRQKRYRKKAMADVFEEDPVLKDSAFASMPGVRDVADPMFVARAYDRIVGGNLEGAVNDISFAHHRHTQFSGFVNNQLHKIRSKAKSQGILDDLPDYLEAKKDLSSLNPQQQEVVASFRKLFDDVREYGVKGGIEIDRVDNYFPRQRLDTADAVTAVRRRFDALGNAAFSDSKEGIEVRRILGEMADMTVESPRDYSRAMRVVEGEGRLKSRLGFEAGAAFKREDKIPTWLQDRDVGRVLQRYTSNITKSVHLAPAIRKLEVEVSSVDGLGLVSGYEYFDRYLKRISGHPSDMMMNISAKKAQLRIAMDKIIDDPSRSPLLRSSAEAAKLAPDMMAWMGAQVYSNFLGFSPKAFVRNLTQSMFLTAPEIGGKYGHKLVAKASIGAAKDKFQLVKMEQFLKEAGYAPGEYLGEGLELVGNGIRASAMGPGVGAVEAIGKTAMWAYGKSDVINRYITVKAARSMFQDVRTAIGKEAQNLTPDEKAAFKFLQKLNPGMRGHVRRLMAAGKLNEAQEEVTKFLLSKTQFNYGPQALSKLGQDWGRMVSMFTKWPSMLFSDALDMISTGRTKELLIRHGGPLLLLGGLQQWISDTSNEPRHRALLGASMVKWAPASSLVVSAPPWFSSAGQAIDFGFKALNGDLDSVDKWGKSGYSIIKPYIPGGVIVNTLERAKDIVTNKK